MPKKTTVKKTSYVPAYLSLYREKCIPEMMKEFSYKSVMQVPRLEKIVLNMGVGAAVQNKNFLDNAITELSLIAGQRAVKTKARKSESVFKIRAGMEIGAKVTLRASRMYDFLYRLINVALPRTKDFRGVNANGFDGHGNYSLGITEHIIFPEIDYDRIDRITGLNITLVTTAKTDDQGRAFLSKFQFPFQKRSL